MRNHNWGGAKWDCCCVIFVERTLLFKQVGQLEFVQSAEQNTRLNGYMKNFMKHAKSTPGFQAVKRNCMSYIIDILIWESIRKQRE